MSTQPLLSTLLILSLVFLMFGNVPKVSTVKAFSTIADPSYRITFHRYPKGDCCIGLYFDGSAYDDGQTAYVAGGNYSLFATGPLTVCPPACDRFDNWSTTGGVSVAHHYVAFTRALVAGSGNLTLFVTNSTQGRPYITFIVNSLDPSSSLLFDGEQFSNLSWSYFPSGNYTAQPSTSTASSVFERWTSTGGVRIVSTNLTSGSATISVTGVGSLNAHYESLSSLTSLSPGFISLTALLIITVELARVRFYVWRTRRRE